VAQKGGIQMGVIYGIESLPPRNENYQIINNDIVETADVCIIGSGAAGAVLAKELVESGKKVVLLERGGYHEGKDMNQRDADMMPLLWKNGGLNFDDNLRIAIAQGCCLGGSTIINDAVCFDTPFPVREEWKNLGVDFTEEEWSTHLQRVKGILHVSEVTEDELNRNNRMLREGANQIGLKDHRKNSRNCINCMQCGFCHLGCHYETKQNVLVTYIHQALQKPDSEMRIYCNCNIDKIVSREGIVEGIEGDFTDIDGKKTYRIRVNSKIVIISAGAIASSKLLLKNNISQDVAGRGLCLHPGIQVIGDFDYEIKGNEGIPMAYTVHDFGVTRRNNESIKTSGYDGCEFLIESIFLPLMQFSIALSASGIIQHRSLIQRLNNYSMAGIVVRDSNLGRVSLTATGRTSVAYDLGEKELKALGKGAEVLGKMWFKLGARRVIVPHRQMSIVENEADIPALMQKIIVDPKNLLIGSAHPQSGNKIGKAPMDSVVDSNCKVHGFRNLFVCDASVFPTAVGVNPQITVMTVASIIASRIVNQWNEKYSEISIQPNIDKTCAISQPMYCLQSNLCEMFGSMETKFGAEMLVNSLSDKADDTNWSFDHENMMIRNNSHWKGIFPRDSNLQNTLALYFGGFWKRFQNNGSSVTGITHPYEVSRVFARNKATEKNLYGFGKVILLEYLDAPYNQFYDVLKITDENTILGIAFFGKPVPNRQIMTFSMSRRYPFEFMDEEDHEILYSKMKKPTFESMEGIWEGQLVSDSAWSPVLFRFRYYFKDKSKRELMNDYLFGGVLSGTATLSEKEDHVEMYDVTGAFHDELKQVNDSTLIGKYYSTSNHAFQWLPEGLSFIHVDRTKTSIFLPYILKKVGSDSSFRNVLV
jgi:choline dehydrogenase-like flavoprotein